MSLKATIRTDPVDGRERKRRERRKWKGNQDELAREKNNHLAGEINTPAPLPRDLEL